MTPAFETFNAAHIASYALTGTQDSTTGKWTASMPAAAVGSYSYCFFLQAGGSPAVGDLPISTVGSIDWTGSVASAAISYLPQAQAGAANGVLISGSNAGTTTLGALTVTGATTLTGAVAANAGVTFTSSTGDGFVCSSTGSNGNGINASGNGTGVGQKITGGTTGNGVSIAGGGTSGNGLNISTSSGHGIAIAAAGTAKNGIISTGAPATGGNAGGDGVRLIGGAASTTSGDTAGIGFHVIGGAGAASTNGAAIGAQFQGGGTNTVASTATGLKVLGTSTGHGLDCESGAGTTGNGLNATSNATNGNGVACAGVGTGDGLAPTGGATGRGIHAIGGATSGAGFRTEGTNGNANGTEFVHNGTGVDLQADIGGRVLGNTATAISGVGVQADIQTIKTQTVTCAAGVTIGAFVGNANAAIGVTAAGKVSEVVLVDTLTTYTGDTPQTGDSYARIGATGSGLTSLAPSATALSTAQWTNTLATNLGTLAGHDPGATLASQTNITGGTLTTVTNLTNAPTAGDFTATMKTSLNAATPASVVGAVGSVTGNVGGNVVGTVASVVGNVGGNVTGSVGSVAGNIGGDVTGKVLGGGASAFTAVGVQADLKTWLGVAPLALSSQLVQATGSFTLDMTEAVPINGAPNSLADCLNAARVQGLGDLALDLTAMTLTLKNYDGTTAKVFNLTEIPGVGGYSARTGV